MNDKQILLEKAKKVEQKEKEFEQEYKRVSDQIYEAKKKMRDRKRHLLSEHG